jgi:hypothetical protein
MSEPKHPHRTAGEAHMGLNNFHADSFFINNIIYICLVVVAMAAHNLAIIRRNKITTFDVSDKRKKVIKNYTDFFVTTWNNLFIFIRNSRLRFLFVKTYSMETFNFLNFEIKFTMLLIAYSTFLIFVMWFYVAFSGGSMRVSEFLIGAFHFSNYTGIVTSYAFFFAVSLYLVIYLISSDAYKIHLHFFLHKTDLKSKYSLIANVVHLTNISTKLSKADIENLIAKTLEIDKKDFILIMYPQVAKLCRYETKIDDFRDKLAALEQDQSRLNSLVFKSRDKVIDELHRKIALYRQKYMKELNADLKYNGRGVIFFYNIKDIERFYLFNIHNKIMLKQPPKIRTGLLDKLANKPQSPIDNDLAVNLVNEKNPVRRIKKYFLASYTDFVVQSFDVSTKTYLPVKILLYTGLVIVLIFLTTPMSLLQTVINVMLKDEDSKSSSSTIVNELVTLFIHMSFPMIVYITNLVLLFIIERIGKLQHFPRHSLYQGYVLRVSFIYLMINMFIIPGFSIGTAKSIFEMFVKSELDINHFIFNLRIYESSNVISLCILQSVMTGYVGTALLFSDLFINKLNYPVILASYKSVQKVHYRQTVGDTYEFGYNYSYDLVIFYLVIVFGIYQPLVAISGVLYFATKSFVNMGSLTNYYKEQIYARCKLLDMTLSRARHGATVSFFILAMKCFILRNQFYFVLNFVFFLCSLTVSLWFRVKSFDIFHLFTPNNYLKFGIKSN